MRPFVLGFAVLFAQSEAAEASRAEAAHLQRALAAHAAEVHGCFARALAPDANVGGELLVRVTLGEDDRVARAEILKDQVGSPILADCLRERMLAWNLPGIGAAGTQVVFPLVFKMAAPQRAVRLADVEPVPRAAKGRTPPLQTWLLLDEKSVGATRASLAVVEVGPRSKIAMHRHPASAELLYVLEGKGRLLLPGAEPQKLEPGTAVYVQPGVAHSIDDQSSRPLRLLQSFAPPGPERALRDRTQSSGTELVAQASAVAPKDGARIVHESDAAPRPILGGKGKAWLLLEKASTGQDGAYLGVLELAAGAVVPTHQHKGSAEILFLVKGKGQGQIAGAEGPWDEGTAVYIPEDTDHTARFSEPTRLVQLYAPAGPEQRFKQAAAPAPAGPGR